MLCLFIVLSALILLPISGMAAGTVTQTLDKMTKDVYRLTYTWTGDASDGSIPATTSTWAIDGYVILVVTNPGTTKPTDNYDITLTDTDSVDVMGGELANRDNTNTEQVVPKIDTVYGGRWVSGHLILTITNQSVNSALGTVVVYIQR